MTDADVLAPDQVEAWIRAKYQFGNYLTVVTEVEQPDKGRVYVTTEITGPNGERLSDGARRAVYTSMRAYAGMDQIEADWVR